MPDGRDVAGHVDRPSTECSHGIACRLNQAVKVFGMNRVVCVDFRPVPPTMFVEKIELGLHRSV
jgi:hypothetical protein